MYRDKIRFILLKNPLCEAQRIWFMKNLLQTGIWRLTGTGKVEQNQSEPELACAPDGNVRRASSNQTNGQDQSTLSAATASQRKR